MKIRNNNRISLRGYQCIAVDECIEYYNTNTPYVLASCPGSGKTIMSVDLCIRLLESGMAKRILVLAHSTTVLKDNFYNECITFIEKKYVSDSFYKDACIHVSIPQNNKKIGDGYDVIIVDEAHQNYLAERVQNIVNKINPKLTLLLTGTPSCFIANEEDYKINVIGMNEIDRSYFHNVGFKLIKSDYKFGTKSYNSDFNIKDTEFFESVETKNTINNVVFGMVKFIANREGVELGDNFNAWDEAVNFFNTNRFGKTLFICRRVEQARQVSDILNSNGIKCRVSDSYVDYDSNFINEFKSGKINVLCVVGRAREGYNDPELVNMVDLSLTHNIDLIYQMYARVVRDLPGYSKEKLYIKITPDVENMPQFTMSTVSAALMLSHNKYLSTFNGRNFSDLVTPRFSVEEESNGQISVAFDDLEDENTTESDEQNTEPRNIERNLDNQLNNDLIDLFVECAEQICEGNVQFATTNIKSCINILSGISFMSKEETFNICVENELVSSSKYTSYRKDNTHLNLYSTPWVVAGESSSIYFGRVKSELGIDDSFMSEEETFKICVENELVSSSKYASYRKDNPQLNLHSNPWKLTKESASFYFGRVRSKLGVDDSFMSEEETFKICVENELVSSSKYTSYRKDNTHLNLYSTPWVVAGESSSIYFGRVKSELGIDDSLMSEEETFKFCVDNELTNSAKYISYRKDNPQIRLRSDPWKLTKESVLVYFGRVKSELGIDDSFMSEEETFKICVENELVSSSKYASYRKDNPQLNLHSNPWKLTKESASFYFGRVRSKLGVDDSFMSEEETFKICVENELVSSSKYASYKKDNPQLNLHSTPWVVAKILNPVYFGRVKSELGIDDSFMSEEETFKFCVDNELVSSSKYTSYRKDNPQLNLHSNPWVVAKISNSVYFGRVKSKLGIDDSFMSEEETFNICVDNELVSSSKYTSYRKDNPQLNLHSNPWRSLGESILVYFGRVKSELGIDDSFMSEEETFNICVDNELTDSIKYESYRKDNPQTRLRSDPWGSSGESISVYFGRVKSELGIDDSLISEEETFNICVENKLTNSSNYISYRKDNAHLNLHSTPWISAGESISVYFGRIKEICGIDKTKRKISLTNRELGDFSKLNKEWSTLNSKNTNNRLKDNPGEWVLYHKLYTKSRQSWDEIPFEEIAHKINKRPDWVVGDFGCGDNILRTLVKNEVHSFDHVAKDETVTACDVSNVPLDDETLDVVVFSLSLMGSNHKDYFKEAHRVLKKYGNVFICEPAKKWEGKREVFKEELESAGFKGIEFFENTEKFFYVDCIKY